jgi:hypothetical protein
MGFDNHYRQLRIQASLDQSLQKQQQQEDEQDNSLKSTENIDAHIQMEDVFEQMEESQSVLQVQVVGVRQQSRHQTQDAAQKDMIDFSSPAPIFDLPVFPELDSLLSTNVAVAAEPDTLSQIQKSEKDVEKEEQQQQESNENLLIERMSPPPTLFLSPRTKPANIPTIILSPATATTSADVHGMETNRQTEEEPFSQMKMETLQMLIPPSSSSSISSSTESYNSDAQSSSSAYTSTHVMGVSEASVSTDIQRSGLHPTYTNVGHEGLVQSILDDLVTSSSSVADFNKGNNSGNRDDEDGDDFMESSMMMLTVASNVSTAGSSPTLDPLTEFSSLEMSFMGGDTTGQTGGGFGTGSSSNSGKGRGRNANIVIPMLDLSASVLEKVTTNNSKNRDSNNNLSSSIISNSSTNFDSPRIPMPPEYKSYASLPQTPVIPSTPNPYNNNGSHHNNHQNSNHSTMNGTGINNQGGSHSSYHYQQANPTVLSYTLSRYLESHPGRRSSIQSIQSIASNASNMGSAGGGVGGGGDFSDFSDLDSSIVMMSMSMDNSMENSMIVVDENDEHMMDVNINVD